MSTEQLFWDLVRGGKPIIKSLPPSFDGQGAKSGYRYYRLQQSSVAYLYEVTNTNTREKHYEVFEKWINGDEKRELLPFEEPVVNEILSSNNNATAMQIWVQVTRERGIQNMEDYSWCKKC
ncbi:hypothetical protein INQ51_08490 [Maribellus sp. CM-23]|uniref:hypothetical protein n=1 Tax=Maribellus sp. CM-23 TaxID=2781026 RepID=UPI001F35CC89|nr:hypothetical protein [Maribellus sp. CM-23]MCE4564348.1 hypothetical protein [Maribellus sp. CM-23]